MQEGRKTNMTSNGYIEAALWAWFGLTALSVVYVGFDLFRRTPEMRVMKWGWLLVTLYAGPVALIIYWFSCREPAPGTHEKFVAPLWKQSVGSTIHCLAGDATGIIVAAAITSLLGLPMFVDSIIEYVAGFAFGLLVFQALFMKEMLGGSYWQAVKGTWLAEWLSMNAVMAGMIPVMVILMSRDMQAMEPSGPRFWAVMSLATLVGAALAFPVNVWLVKKGLKHGMGTERALGRGGSDVEIERERLAAATPGQTVAPMSTAHHPLQPVSDRLAMEGRKMSGEPQAAQAHTAGQRRAGGAGPVPDQGGMKMGGSVSTLGKVVVTLATVAMLAAGIALAARYGNFSMRAGDMNRMPMQMPEGHGGMTR